ncbi:uncharacterized protein K02A2.6-like [Papaver somniferum]|uniref:uncharacterized protein K02A2.6-like n=1 Tax=Papaver somniferum TaxID=3469 RepID=UPI000E704FC3|nr:uncharacterized protein K02A2.6-like [Papaver somniferum]
MDGYSGYNQVALEEEDQQHTAFYTPYDLYCYTRMPFGLRNAEATYHRMVDAIFKPWIGNTLEVYVDDMLVKSKLRKDHHQDLRDIFEAMRKHNMKVNPEKCTFGVTSGKFLGYLQSFSTNREDDVEEDITDDDVGEDIAEDFVEDDILTRANEDEDFSNEEDWRTEVHLYLREGTLPTDLKQDRKIQSKAGIYDLRDGVLYKKSFLGLLLCCLSRKEGHRVLKDIHYGDAGNHSGMRSLADKEKMQGYYWPKMIRDAARMSRRCEECQRFFKRIHALAMNLNSVDSPWPFSKWGIYIVGPLIEGSGKIQFLIVATDYFRKWVEVKALARILDVDIRKKKSTLIYPQSNGQAEDTNKTLSLILKKSLEHKGRWCEQLHNVLWAYRTTHRSATGESHFLLTYGVEAVITTEIIMTTTKTEAWEKNLTADMMLERLNDLEDRRETTLQRMENYQRRLEREYNKKIKLRNFVEGQYVLRTIPQYQQEQRWGKFAPTWGGSFIIHDIAGNGFYYLRNLKGEVLRHPWNAKYLNPYDP